MSQEGAVRLLFVSAMGAWAAVAASAQPAGPQAFPARAVVPDVPRVGYDVHLCPFPGSLYAVMGFLGEPCGYDYTMGTSGAAFRRIWNRDDGGNVDLMYLAPEPYERVFAALGYEFRVVPGDDKAAMIQAVRESIAAGRPVLGFVLVGPPERGVITGYDKDGETLVGWSYFQEGPKDQYCEVPDWFQRAASHSGQGLILVGDKKREMPDQREVLISSLKWVIDLARTSERPTIPDHVCGLAAYDAWADGLEVDEDYPADDFETMSTRCMVHCDQCVMLHERLSAAAYLRLMGPEVPEVMDHLEAAAGHYEDAAACGKGLWRWASWDDPATQRAFADREFRVQAAKSIRAARDHEALAVEDLEQALAELEPPDAAQAHR